MVEDALEAGYRHIDTAAAYRNEKGVGEAIAASGIPREEVFVTTKLWNSQQGYDSALAAFEHSLGRLGIDHVDLYLIHWPVPTEDLFVDTWRAFERIHEEGGARTIGVSNFRDRGPRTARSARPRPGRRSTRSSSIPGSSRPSCAPGTPSTRSRPRPGARSPRPGTLDDETIAPIAAAHGKTPAQVILRWHIQLGNIVFPKSVTPERIRENIDIFDFELTEDEMAAFEGLDAGERTGPDPATFVSP